jgi:ketosteroid isomerase-like protein
MFAGAGLLAMVANLNAAKAQSAALHSYAADSASAVAAVERYHDVLRKGDKEGAVSMLEERAVVLESGEIEKRQEYIEHHLAADMEFAKSVSSPSRVESVMVRGDMAWVASTSRSTGTFNGRAIDSDGAELMVLLRSGPGWRIAAIHWSSHRRPTR